MYGYDKEILEVFKQEVSRISNEPATMYDIDISLESIPEFPEYPDKYIARENEGDTEFEFDGEKPITLLDDKTRRQPDGSFRSYVRAKYHGKYGKRSFSYNALYKGKFKDGKPHGKGTLILPTGSKYVGDFRNGMLTGKGNFGNYKGEFVNGKLNGKGSYYGRWFEYVGEFKNGEPHGKGTLTELSGGKKYIGEFKNGAKDGHGTVILPNGERLEGTFKDGNLYQWGSHIFADGHRYVGEFKNEKPHGLGTLYDINGKVCYQGIFKMEESGTVNVKHGNWMVLEPSPSMIACIEHL